MSRCALLFTGGKGPTSFDSSLVAPFQCVAAADSGLELALSLGFEVDYVVGDFDSLTQKELLENRRVETLPKEKDISDTEALLQFMIKEKFECYTLIGGGEGRFDHLLHLYSLFTRYFPPTLWITAQERLHLVTKREEFTLRVGQTLSLLPALIQGESKVTSCGLYWELSSYLINSTHHSLSNRANLPLLTLEVDGDPLFLSLPLL